MLTDGPSKHEIEALISISKGALTPHHAASLLRQYDNNLHEAAVAVLDRPYVNLPTRMQAQRAPQIGHGEPKGKTVEVPESQSVLPSTKVDVGAGDADDTFNWFEIPRSVSQSQPQANPSAYTLKNAHSGIEGPEETPKIAQAKGKGISRLVTQHQGQVQNQDESDTGQHENCGMVLQRSQGQANRAPTGLGRGAVREAGENSGEA